MSRSDELKAEVLSWSWEGRYGEPGAVELDLQDAEVLYAVYISGCYEGDCVVVYRKDGGLFAVQSSHCSCNGLYWQPAGYEDARAVVEDLPKWGGDRKPVADALGVELTPGGDVK